MSRAFAAGSSLDPNTSTEVLQATFQDELRLVLESWRADNLSVALVPTMGNLHAGHLALVQRAVELCDRVVVSIFVNPTQFGEGEDFNTYPRTLDADLQKLESAGAHLAFTPDVETMYPFGLENAVRLAAPPMLGSILDGAHRPGHFDGVVTVVARLFNLVGPQVAVFGEKDFQQLLVIKQMTRDLGYPVRIEAVETRREEGGLAMSSRNAYLDDEQRRAARHISRAIDQVVHGIEHGESDYGELQRKASEFLEKEGLEVEYVEIRSANDLQIPGDDESPLRVLVAARVGQTRLIDNKSATNVCN